MSLEAQLKRRDKLTALHGRCFGNKELKSAMAAATADGSDLQDMERADIKKKKRDALPDAAKTVASTKADARAKMTTIVQDIVTCYQSTCDEFGIPQEVALVAPASENVLSGSLHPVETLVVITEALLKQKAFVVRIKTARKAVDVAFGALNKELTDGAKAISERTAGATSATIAAANPRLSQLCASQQSASSSPSTLLTSFSPLRDSTAVGNSATLTMNSKKPVEKLVKAKAQEAVLGVQTAVVSLLNELEKMEESAKAMQMKDTIVNALAANISSKRKSTATGPAAAAAVWRKDSSNEQSSAEHSRSASLSSTWKRAILSAAAPRGEESKDSDSNSLLLFQQQDSVLLDEIVGGGGGGDVPMTSGSSSFVAANDNTINTMNNTDSLAQPVERLVKNQKQAVVDHLTKQLQSLRRLHNHTILIQNAAKLFETPLLMLPPPQYTHANTSSSQSLGPRHQSQFTHYTAAADVYDRSTDLLDATIPHPETLSQNSTSTPASSTLTSLPYQQLEPSTDGSTSQPQSRLSGAARRATQDTASSRRSGTSISGRSRSGSRAMPSNVDRTALQKAWAMWEKVADGGAVDVAPQFSRIKERYVPMGDQRRYKQSKRHGVLGAGAFATRAYNYDQKLEEECRTRVLMQPAPGTRNGPQTAVVKEDAAAVTIPTAAAGGADVVVEHDIDPNIEHNESDSDESMSSGSSTSSPTPYQRSSSHSRSGMLESVSMETSISPHHGQLQRSQSAKQQSSSGSGFALLKRAVTATGVARALNNGQLSPLGTPVPSPRLMGVTKDGTNTEASNSNSTNLGARQGSGHHIKRKASRRFGGLGRNRHHVEDPTAGLKFVKYCHAGINDIMDPHQRLVAIQQLAARTIRFAFQRRSVLSAAKRSAENVVYAEEASTREAVERQFTEELNAVRQLLERRRISAANKIQRAWNRHDTHKKHIAALLEQLALKQQQRSAVVIQHWIRRQLPNRKEAKEIGLSKIWRKRRERAALQVEVETFNNALVTIQRIMRGAMRRKALVGELAGHYEQKKHDAMVLPMKALEARRYVAKLQRVHAAERASKIASALITLTVIRIQKVVRGHLARVLAKKLRRINELDPRIRQDKQIRRLQIWYLKYKAIREANKRRRLRDANHEHQRLRSLWAESVKKIEGLYFIWKAHGVAKQKRRELRERKIADARERLKHVGEQYRKEKSSVRFSADHIEKLCGDCNDTTSFTWTTTPVMKRHLNRIRHIDATTVPGLNLSAAGINSSLMGTSTLLNNSTAHLAQSKDARSHDDEEPVSILKKQIGRAPPALLYLLRMMATNAHELTNASMHVDESKGSFHADESGDTKTYGADAERLSPDADAESYLSQSMAATVETARSTEGGFEYTAKPTTPEDTTSPMFKASNVGLPSPSSIHALLSAGLGLLNPALNVPPPVTSNARDVELSFTSIGSGTGIASVQPLESTQHSHQHQHHRFSNPLSNALSLTQPPPPPPTGMSVSNHPSIAARVLSTRSSLSMVSLQDDDAKSDSSAESTLSGGISGARQFLSITSAAPPLPSSSEAISVLAANEPPRSFSANDQQLMSTSYLKVQSLYDNSCYDSMQSSFMESSGRRASSAFGPRRLSESTSGVVAWPPRALRMPSMGNSSQLRMPRLSLPHIDLTNLPLPPLTSAPQICTRITLRRLTSDSTVTKRRFAAKWGYLKRPRNLNDGFSTKQAALRRVHSPAASYEAFTVPGELKRCPRPYCSWNNAKQFTNTVTEAAVHHAWRMIFSHTAFDRDKHESLSPRSQDERLARVHHRRQCILSCYGVKSEQEWVAHAKEDISFLGDVRYPQFEETEDPAEHEQLMDAAEKTFEFVHNFVCDSFPMVRGLSDVPIQAMDFAVRNLLRQMCGFELSDDVGTVHSTGTHGERTRLGERNPVILAAFGADALEILCTQLPCFATSRSPSFVELHDSSSIPDSAIGGGDTQNPGASASMPDIFSQTKSFVEDVTVATSSSGNGGLTSKNSVMIPLRQLASSQATTVTSRDTSKKDDTSPQPIAANPQIRRNVAEEFERVTEALVNLLFYGHASGRKYEGSDGDSNLDTTGEEEEDQEDDQVGCHIEASGDFDSEELEEDEDSSYDS